MRKRPSVERADRVRERAPAYRRSRRPSAEALAAAIEADPKLRVRLAGLLGVPAGLPEALQRLADEMRQMRLASAARFELITNRFEASDRRFEAVQQELREQRLASDARFEASDRRFGAVQQELREQRLASDARLEAINRRFDKIDDMLRTALLHLGGFTQRAGHQMEDLVAGTLRFGLQRPDIRPDQVRVRQTFVDTEGKLGRKGREVEMDIIAADGMTYLLEVRSYVHSGDVQAFAEKADFVAAMMGLAPGKFEKVFAALDKAGHVVDACRKAGVTLI